MKVRVDAVEAARGRVDLVPAGSGGGGARSMSKTRQAKGGVGRRRDEPPRARTPTSSIERFEAGIELQGTEVKSLRDGKAQIGDAYAVIEDGEVWLRDAHIPPYDPAHRQPRSRAARASCSCTATRSSA